MATPSLAMIPSAYADSKVYSVLPNNGDGDFTFNRDSSATRVGQNGLIQTVGYFGSEEVTNGDFSDSSDWTLGTGVTISGGKAVFTNVSNATQGIAQSNVAVVGKTYKITFTISDYNQGAVYILRPTSLGSGNAISSNGTFTFTLEAQTSTSFILYTVGTTTLSVDNVSVKEVTGDQPRLNYDISNGVVQSCPSLLLEPSSTNLIAYSQDFSNYSTVLGIIAESGFTDPSGTTTAYKLSNFANNGSRFDYTTPATAVNGTTYTYSAYYKGSGTIRINCSTSGGVGGSGEKDIVLTNEWKREEISFTAVNPTGNVKTHTAITRTANNNAIVYLAFTQIEALSYPTSYIPTTGSSQTRAAETCFGAGTSSTFNSTEGVLYLDFASLNNAGNYRLISLSDGTTSNRLFIGFRLDTGYLYYFVIVAGSTQASNITTITATDFTKVAVKWKANDFALWVDGVEISSDTSGISFPADTLNTIQMNEGDGAGFEFYGKVKDVRVYNEALTDLQLQKLTTL